MAKDQTATPATHLPGPVYIEALDPAQTAFTALTGDITALTDSSGGTASDTIGASSATYAAAEQNDIHASFAAKINALRADLEALKERIV